MKDFQSIVKKVARVATRQRKRRVRHRQLISPVRLTPAMDYGDCLDSVREQRMDWTSLLEYDGYASPSPEIVIEHILEAHGMLTEQQWETAIRYLSIRCHNAPYHYATCKRRIADLVGRFEQRSSLISSSLCGLAIFSGDAKGAVQVVRESRSFHQNPFSWISFPPHIWYEEKSNPLSRLHLNSIQFYYKRISQGYPATLLALHSLFAYAVMKNDKDLFSSLIRAIVSEWGDSPPLLLPDTISLINASLSDISHCSEACTILIDTYNKGLAT